MNSPLLRSRSDREPDGPCDMTDSPLRFAVAGLGHIGKRHAEMVRRHPGCELVAGCDIRSREETEAGCRAIIEGID